MSAPGWHDKRIVAMRTREVAGHKHVSMVKLEDDTEVTADEVMRQIRERVANYVMIPPSGAPAYEAYMATGYPLMVQIRQCPDCGEKVLFA